jgi:hypothetical protein
MSNPHYLGHVISLLEDLCRSRGELILLRGIPVSIVIKLIPLDFDTSLRVRKQHVLSNED